MPWSDWQPGDRWLMPWAQRIYVTEDDGSLEMHAPDGSPMSPPYTEAAPFDIDAPFASSAERRIDGTLVSIGGVLYLLADGWLRLRKWSPDLMAGMTFGVDYGVRPDRTESDEDAYVEYADEDNDGLYWSVGPDLTYAASTNVHTGETDAFGNPLPQPQGRFAISYTSANSAFPHTTYTEFAPYPGDTSQILSGDCLPDDVRRTFPVDGLAFAGRELAVKVANSVDTTITTDQAAVVSMSMRVTLPVAGVVVQLPQWRYWIPDIRKPLRQRQRDDGLGMTGTPRWRRGTSRQTSNRWRGYL